MKCQKCGYLRQSSDNAPSWQCPSCQVVYSKIKKLEQPSSPQMPAHVLPSDKRASQIVEDVEATSDSEREALAASGQKIVIYCIVANFVLRSVEQAHAFTPFFMQLLYVVTAIVSLVGVTRICSGLQKTQGAKIAFMTLSFWPLINLIVLIYLSAKTNRMLRDAGWRVGLFGAKP